MEKKTNPKITKDTLIGEAMSYGSNCSDVVNEYFGGACLACGGRFMETLEMGLISHGLEKEIPTAIQKLEEALVKDLATKSKDK